MGLSRQGYWSGLPCPPSGDLPNPGIEPVSLTSPALAGRFFTTSASWEALSGSSWILFSIQNTACGTHKLRKTERQPRKARDFQGAGEGKSEGHQAQIGGQRVPGGMALGEETLITYLIHVSILKEDCSSVKSVLVTAKWLCSPQNWKITNPRENSKLYKKRNVITGETVYMLNTTKMPKNADLTSTRKMEGM